MTYDDVVNALVGEVAADLKELGFHAAFSNAPSFSQLTESEVKKAKREVASRLASRANGGKKNKKKKQAPTIIVTVARRYEQINLF